MQAHGATSYHKFFTSAQSDLNRHGSSGRPILRATEIVMIPLMRSRGNSVTSAQNSGSSCSARIVFPDREIEILLIFTFVTFINIDASSKYSRQI